MEQKLRNFNATTFEPKYKKFSAQEVVDRFKQITGMIETMAGPKDTWNEHLVKCLDSIKYEIQCIQFPPIEDLECQYESKNSMNNDL